MGLKTAYRICMELRHINALLASEGFSNGRVPKVDELLSRLEGFTHASTLDLSAAYNQLEVAKEDRHKLAFTYKGRRLQWKRWPFGLAPATAQFQKVMEIVLDGIESAVAYVDDVAIFTNGTIDDHAKAVNLVLERLNKHGLRLNLDKCHFGFKEITLLGHQVSGDHRSADPVKIRQTVDWPEPKSGKEVQRFLGFTNFLRGYVINYAQLASPLDRLRSAKKVEFNDEERAAFEKLKAVINRSPHLSMPDPDLPFQVATDASQCGLGAVLYQQAEGSSERRFIAFASKSLDGAQRNYPATKRELLGVVFALRAFSHWLLGNRFVLYTDHMSLTTMFTQPKQSHVICNWMDVLLEYDFEIRHRPGVHMVIPDTLSRIYAPDDDVDLADAIAVRAVRLLTKVAAPNKELAAFIKERHGKKTLASEDEQIRYLRAAHAAGHFGSEHLFKHTWRDGYFWPGLREQCESIVSTCLPCISYSVKI
jgi:hypothetical protein